jgi:hypothetical protein
MISCSGSAPEPTDSDAATVVTAWSGRAAASDGPTLFFRLAAGPPVGWLLLDSELTQLSLA